METPPGRSDFAPGEGEVPAAEDALGDGDSSGDGLGEGVGDVIRFLRGEDDGEGEALGDGDSSGEGLGEGVGDAFRFFRGEGEGDADGDGDLFGVDVAEAVDFGDALGLGEALGFGRGEGEGVGDDFFFEETDRFFGTGVGVGSRRRFSFVPNDGSARDPTANGPAMSANPHSTATPMRQSLPLFNAPVPGGSLCSTGSQHRNSRAENFRWANAPGNRTARARAAASRRRECSGTAT